MTERYIVIHAPKAESVDEATVFAQKGLAFAYVKRRLPVNRNGAIHVHLQITGQPESGAEYDSKTGLFWTTIDTWTYHRDGLIEHRRT
jgi:hypothetical protein